MAQLNNEKIYGVYIKSILNKKVVLSITEIGSNTKKNSRKKKLTYGVEGKCIAEGLYDQVRLELLVIHHPLYTGMMSNSIQYLNV